MPTSSPAASHALRPLILFLSAVFALGSLGIDTMLPSLSAIAGDLHLSNAAQAQWVVTSFGFGMGVGNLFAGPLSDACGRRALILAGCGLYVVGALTGLFAPTLPLLIAGRLVQGGGAAFATVAATALVRDLHAGEHPPVW